MLLLLPSSAGGRSSLRLYRRGNRGSERAFPKAAGSSVGMPSGKWDFVARAPCLWQPSILPGVGSRPGREAHSARTPRGAGTEALPTEDRPAGRAAAALGGLSTRGARTRRGGIGARGRGDPPPSSPHPPRPDSALRGASNPDGPERRHQPQPPVLRNSQGQLGDHRLPSLFRSWASQSALPASLSLIKNNGTESTPPPAAGTAFATQFP